MEPPLRVAFDRRIKLEFHGARITSDGGLLAFRELGDALGLSALRPVLGEGRRGRNIRHHLLGLLRSTEPLVALRLTNGRPRGTVELKDERHLEDLGEVHSAEIVGHPSLAAGANGLELVDQVDDVEEAAAGTIADAGAGDRDRQVALDGSVGRNGRKTPLTHSVVS